MYFVTKEDIDVYISVFVQADETYLKQCGVAVDRLVTFLQHNAPEIVRPSSVFKGGSFCKGTSIKGKSDVDMVVMLSKYSDVRTMVDNMKPLLREIETCMRKYPGLKVCKGTHRCVEVDIEVGNGDPMSADVLPAVDILNIENTRASIYEKMGGQDRDIRDNYSPCLAPLQKELFAELPTKLKSLIRLVKYWRKEKLVKERGIKWPTSYVLELVILNAWTEAGECQAFDMTRGLHAVLQSLVNHKQFRVVFEKRMFYERKYLEILDTPYIMDPCNPYNNAYYKGSWAWEETANKANEWLQRPLFYGVVNTKKRW